jgi:hypothetical protein
MMISVILATLCIDRLVLANNYFRQLFAVQQNDNDTWTMQSFDATSFNCTVGPTSPECSYHGTCTADGLGCICNTQYTTCPASNALKCNYQQKSAPTAFLLELFLGEFGAGYFYLGANDMGAGQIVLTFVGVFLLCVVFLCVGFNSGDSTVGFFFVLSFDCMWVMAVVGWWIAACVTIGQGHVLDGNGCAVPSL